MLCLTYIDIFIPGNRLRRLPLLHPLHNAHQNVVLSRLLRALQHSSVLPNAPRSHAAGTVVHATVLQEFGVDKFFILENNNVDTSQRNVVFVARAECGRHAESIAHKHLVWYDGFVLKVRDVERDIVPKPRTSLFILENATLHFGSPVSQNKFSVLWSAMDVKVNFGFNLRKILEMRKKGRSP